MKVSEILAGASMRPVPRGRNIGSIGWVAGYMPVTFKGRPTIWIYGPDIPAEEMDKILRVPYPDKLFTTNIKNKFKCHKVS